MTLNGPVQVQHSPTIDDQDAEFAELRMVSVATVLGWP
jgi:hypothetical protein